MAEFRAFAERAAPLAIARVRGALPLIAVRASLLNRWLTEHDLLDVAGLSYAENPYIELLAWALAPETDPRSATARQSSWLAALKLDPMPAVERAVPPVTQYVTSDGRPDLLLHYPDAVVVVEVKTGTEEHETPSGLHQTEAYAASVRKVLRLPPDMPVHVVFLTPSRERAMNPAAIPTTFVEFVLSVAAALEAHDPPEGTVWAYRMLSRHLLTNASPVSGDVLSLVRLIATWSSRADWDDPVAIARRLPEFLRAYRLLLPGEEND